MRKNRSLRHPGQAGVKVWPLVGALAAAGLASGMLGGCAMTDTKAVQGETLVPGLQIKAMPLQVRGNKTPEGYYAMGKYFFYQGRLEKAKEAFTDAVRLDPGHVDALNGLGAVFDRLGQYDSAEKAYRAALLKDPKAAHVWANLGYSLLLAGKAGDALEPLQKAVGLDPDNAVARQHLASAGAGGVNAAGAAPAETGRLAAAGRQIESGPQEPAKPEAAAGEAGPAAPTAAPVHRPTVAAAPEAAMPRSVEGPIVNIVTARGVATAEAKAPEAPVPAVVSVSQAAAPEAPVRADAPAVAAEAAGTPARPPVQIVATIQADRVASPPLESPIVNIVTAANSAGAVTIEARSPLAAVLPVSLPASDGTPAAAAQATMEPRLERVVHLSVGTARPEAAEPDAPLRPEAAPVIARDEVRISEVLGGLRIEVSNGNGVTGMARAVGTEMRETGLKVARITNARPFNKARTVILCRPELKEAAQALAQTLPSNPKVVYTDIGHRRVDMRVVLGTDSVQAREAGAKKPFLAAGSRTLVKSEWTPASGSAAPQGKG